ncbi:MAG: hypothetical protein J5884_03625 [Paludibacteraceae bacterium]|nr:hypothetical protein [Paludibacteraceae bacterium]
MKKFIFLITCSAIFWMACTHENLAEKRRTERHVQDSVALVAQQRSLLYYESQLEQMLPKADSLIALFKYEKNDKYQDHGYYIATTYNGLRILVRDDGQDLLIYRDGKRIKPYREQLKGKDQEAYDRAQELQITISDIQELEKRIQRTNLEIRKYQKRLQKTKKSL